MRRFKAKTNNRHPTEAARSTLGRKNLACWCRLCAEHKDGKPPGVMCQACDPCHADVLLEVANQGWEATDGAMDRPILFSGAHIGRVGDAETPP